MIPPNYVVVLRAQWVTYPSSFFTTIVAAAAAAAEQSLLLSSYNVVDCNF